MLLDPCLEAGRMGAKWNLRSSTSYLCIVSTGDAMNTSPGSRSLRSYIRIISCYFMLPWAQREPDLTPTDLWPWESLKSKLYASNLQNVSDLKDAIQCEIQQIPVHMVGVAVLSTICLL
ncbi:hypothetical protein AVEN_191066-1 [Araneus ventricosus]|uniref:Uncharacterized protein n=1 Tax=Araneus ventricosus TaxID=182803 RepID=A0A4Y2AXL5_ARAVE|nr:hypothetical protein AVEN_191066-1 [Araneus ventricosus]